MSNICEWTKLGKNGKEPTGYKTDCDFRFYTNDRELEANTSIKSFKYCPFCKRPILIQEYEKPLKFKSVEPRVGKYIENEKGWLVWSSEDEAEVIELTAPSVPEVIQLWNSLVNF